MGCILKNHLDDLLGKGYIEQNNKFLAVEYNVIPVIP